MKQSLIIIGLLLVAACDRRPPAPTAEQNAQLNEAEAMLDNLVESEKGPAANATGPAH